jgi:hypothetical protein
MPLLDSIEALAEDFAFKIVAAVREASLNDLVAIADRSTATTETGVGRALGAPVAKPKARGTGGRRAPADISGKALEVLRRSPDGVRTETLRTLVGGEKGAYQRAMAKLVADGRVVKTGAKRATTYRAG